MFKKKTLLEEPKLKKRSKKVHIKIIEIAIPVDPIVIVSIVAIFIIIEDSLIKLVSPIVPIL